MSVHVKYYIPTTPVNTVSDPDLAYVNVLRVTRDGLVYTKTDSIPAEGSMNFQHDASIGEIIFDPANPFIIPYGRPNLKLLTKVTVKYEI